MHCNKQLYSYSTVQVTDDRVVRVGVTGHEMQCYDLEVMNLNPGQVELEAHSASVLSHTGTKNIIEIAYF